MPQWMRSSAKVPGGCCRREFCRCLVLCAARMKPLRTALCSCKVQEARTYWVTIDFHVLNLSLGIPAFGSELGVDLNVSCPGYYWLFTQILLKSYIYKAFCNALQSTCETSCQTEDPGSSREGNRHLPRWYRSSSLGFVQLYMK